MALTELPERVAGNQVDLDVRVAPAVHVSCPTALRQIHNRDTALTVWRRSLSDDVDAELAGLVLGEVDDILFASETGALETALPGAMEQAGYPGLPALTADIAMLARQHAAVTGDAKIRIRLEVVETDACRKFHSDYVTLRTITTYLGEGTQWIEVKARDMAGLSGEPEIRQLGVGDVGMFKGRLWQEAPTILHRSPPIGDTDAQRLVLVIDPAPDEDERAIRLEEKCA
ncbi:DUF1826 domain-containing protein [Sphingobium sp. BYY-5]|uniref:DUF1826 domain-containing protein n=1 Tax=Sphingobium sp. BYY-5 TaxID=2926400 RepID=UPI001FA6EF57|nr:DUF1826 domain-containing protein [Sphingobium sp. BYY-5]MCI4591086.1 DUF1826 domain-containing protein [Sphingobium sp. BYY-5]